MPAYPITVVGTTLADAYQSSKANGCALIVLARRDGESAGQRLSVVVRCPRRNDRTHDLQLGYARQGMPAIWIGKAAAFGAVNRLPLLTIAAEVVALADETSATRRAG